MNDFAFYAQQYLDAHPYIVPLGIIGFWRWGIWLLKELVALKYRPKKTSYKASISIVTPVYNENPKVFSKALETWAKNKPQEIIAVIDYTDKKCIKIFRDFKKKFKSSNLIITKVPGKRPALALGIKKAKGEIVALVDSDTLWDKDVIKNALPPFNDKKMGGVGTYQNVLNPKTIAQRIFDIQLDIRYRDEMPFLSAAGDALVCLSGRTAFYRRKVIIPMLNELVNETFMGKPVISGDDKRLTYLVLSHGWKVYFQSNSHVYTPGMADIKSYLQQRIRWSRNALRADLKAIKEGWVFRHPALVFFQIDKIFQSVAVMLSPIFFIVSLLMGIYSVALLIFVWWFISRSIKMFPHLRRTPKDILMVPVFILYTFTTGFLKLYALFTLNTQGWITRWDKSRMPQLRFIKEAPAYALTMIVLIFLGLGVYAYKNLTYFIPRAQEEKLIATTLPTKNIQETPINPITVKTGSVAGKHLVQKYVTKPGDGIGNIAAAYGSDFSTVLLANVAKITNWNRIPAGLIFSIPAKDTTLTGYARFNYQRFYDDFLSITYDQTTNTIIVAGRGKTVNLLNIQNSVGKDLLTEETPGVWLLKANLYLKSGTTLNLDKNEVTWLKLLSTKDKFTYVRGLNTTIEVNGVKVTSWDTAKNDYDREMQDGRSYILVKDGSRMDILDSDLGYLGYPRALSPETSPYGVSWRMSTGKLGSTLLTGDIERSKFHNNYFGAYTFGATGMTWRENEFFNNVRYGLDPHDDSNGFLVENNVFHDNGSHGLIFSKRCVENVIRNNISYGNKLHGIMLHQNSNNNLIEGNKLYDNNDGIAIWDSSYNIIRNNQITNNKRGVRTNDVSIHNLVEKNNISGNSQYGIYTYEKSDENIFRNNTLHDNLVGLYIKTNGNEITKNDIQHNKTGIYLLSNVTNNKIFNNKIFYSLEYGIYAKIDENVSNPTNGNNLYRNRRNIVAFPFNSTLSAISIK